METDRWEPYGRIRTDAEYRQALDAIDARLAQQDRRTAAPPPQHRHGPWSRRIIPAPGQWGAWTVTPGPPTATPTGDYVDPPDEPWWLRDTRQVYRSVTVIPPHRRSRPRVIASTHTVDVGNGPRTVTYRGRPRPFGWRPRIAAGTSPALPVTARDRTDARRAAWLSTRDAVGGVAYHRTGTDGAVERVDVDLERWDRGRGGRPARYSLIVGR